MTKKAARIVEGRYKALLEAAKSKSIPFFVLWGPSPSDPKGYKKREKVAHAIQSESPSAAVVFPEDQDVVALTNKYTVKTDLQERLQASLADLVFALALSPGVETEIARYSRDKAIAGRLIVIAPESIRDGFLGTIMNGLTVHYVRDSELVRCDTASGLCRMEVRSWFVRKLLDSENTYDSKMLPPSLA